MSYGLNFKLDEIRIAIKLKIYLENSLYDMQA